MLNLILALALAPNIIISLVDEQGISSLNGPNYERIKSEGAYFSTHYATQLCTPSRASLLTAREPSRSGSTGLFGPNNTHGLPLNEVTLAELLRSAGYTTGMVGKWHLGANLSFSPNHQGFDYSWHLPTGHGDGPMLTIYENDVPIFDAVRTSAAGKAEMNILTSLELQAALRFMHEAPEPWVLYVPWSVIHVPVPCEAPLTKESTLNCGKRELDNALGALYDARPENTIFLTMGDNGDPKPEGNGGLRGKKGSFYDGGLRTPAIMNWEGRTGVISEPVSILDWMPTLAEIVGVPMPTDRSIDGRSLVSLMNGGSRCEKPLWWVGGMRVGDFKYVKKGDEVYNLASDPNETTKLTGPIVAQLKTQHKALTPRKGL